ncbi:hypothetical protein ABEB36_011685 [Hypothenemus hampei]|uniref:Uncharacterized protein n=1 Tax=Hypothenemus hampei TaxID=57062 RepID=A0ABD1EAR8_HYPHA
MANDLDKKIIKQVEYYFGDINLPRDQFLQKQIKEDENGWVPLDVMLKFNRLAAISKDSQVIVEALEKSEEKLVEVNEDKTKIRRNPDKPVPENKEGHLKKLQERSAYAKGFPLDSELNDIINFMDQYGPVESVIRRTEKENKFKGSCFIVFKTQELAKQFVELDTVKYKDIALLRKMQIDYYADKKKDIEERKQAKKDKKEALIKETAQKIELPNGAILQFSGLPEGQQLTREEIKEKIRESGDFEVVYVDYNKGDLDGYVRFAKENNAVDFFKTLTDGELVIGEHKIKVKALEGEEEKQYLAKTLEVMATQRQKQKNYGKKRKGNFNSGKKHLRNAKHPKKN